MYKRPERIWIGLAAVHARELCKDTERAKRIARLIFDERWPRAFSKWHVQPFGGTGLDVIAGRLPPNPLQEVEAKLSASTTHWVDLQTPGEAWHCVSIQPGATEDPRPAQSHASLALEKLKDPPGDVSRWVPLAHDLVLALGARNATITVAPSGDVISDVWNTYVPAPNNHLCIMGDVARNHEARLHLGTKYARYPRWGTYLHPEHVAAIGGREQIAREVEPVVFEEVGDLLYIQLTAGIEDAWTPLMWEKRLKLRELMQPILVS